MSKWRPKGAIPVTEPNEWKPPGAVPIGKDALIKAAERIPAEPVSPEISWGREKLRSGEIEKVQPSWWQETKKKLPQYLGGAAGGIVGAATAGPEPTDLVTVPAAYSGVAKLAGAVLGAGLGGAGGTGYQQAYRMTRSGAQGENLKDLYVDQLLAGLEEAGTELAGRGLAKGIQVGTKALGKKVVKPAVRRSAQLLLKEKAPPTLAQLTENRLLDIMEAVSEGSLFGGGGMQRLKTIKQPAAISRLVQGLSDDYVKAVGKQLTPEEIGDILLDTINKKNTAFRQASKSIYKQVDKLMRRAGRQPDIVDLTPLKKFAGKKASSRLSVSRSQMGDTLLDTIQKLPDKVSFKQAAGLRTSLLNQSRSMGASRDVAQGIAKQFTKMTDSAIQKASKDLPPDAMNLWRFANKFHRQGKQIFTKRLIKNLTRTLAENPERAVDKIFRPHATQQIRTIRKLVGPQTWDTLQQGYLQKAVARATEPATGIFRGKTFLKELEKLGDDALDASFSETQIKRMKEIAETAILTQRPTQEFASTGRIMIAIAQAGAVLRWGKEGATLIMGPWALGKIMKNPVWAKMLVRGLKPEKGSASLLRLVKLVNEAAKKRKAAREQTEPPLRKPSFGHHF